MNTLEHIYMNINCWMDLGLEDHANYSGGQSALESLETTLNQLDGLLSEFGSIDRIFQDEHIEKVFQATEAMAFCRRELSDDIAEYIDKPLKKRFNDLDDIFATIDERNIKTPNTLGIEANNYYYEHGHRFERGRELNELTLKDMAGTRADSIGVKYDQNVEEIVGVLLEEYHLEVERRNSNALIDKKEEFTYNEFVQMNYTISEERFVKDKTSWEKIQNVLWCATGVGFVCDAAMGFSLINGDRLTVGERKERFAEGALMTTFNILPGVAVLGEAGFLEAAVMTAETIEFNAVVMSVPTATREAGIGEVGFLFEMCMAAVALDEIFKNVGGPIVAGGSCSSLRDLMSPEEVARYDEYWVNVAETISNEALDNQIAFIKSGGITKSGGGKYQPAKISATVDLNTGDIYFGYNGTNKFNPSRTEIVLELQQRIDYTMNLAKNTKGNMYANKSSFEIWSVDNCAEVYSVNNALIGGADINNLFINTKFFNNGVYAEPCKNCQITFKGIKMPKGGE